MPATPPSSDKQRLINYVVESLREQRVEYQPYDRAGVHILVTSPEGEKIDVWPTTGKWRRAGEDSTSNNMHDFWRAIETWGNTNG